MISFILFDNNNKMKDIYERIIKKFLYSTNDFYKIYEFGHYGNDEKELCKKIEGRRIYLINIDSVSFDGISIARNIRALGDFISPIILITSRDSSAVIEQLHNVLFLDLIVQNKAFLDNLMSSLKEAYKIVTRHSVYTFSIFDEVYRIPYNDIYYIKKNLNENSVTVYTKDDSYLNYITVKGIENILGKDARFLKVHRSCIINLYNVESYNKKDNFVLFNNGLTTNLVSKANKNKLEEKLKDHDLK